VKKIVHEFATYGVTRQAQRYVEIIQDVNGRLKNITSEMRHINEQQTDLDLLMGEYPVIDELKVQIKPYEELWNLYVLQEQKLVKTWK